MSRYLVVGFAVICVVIIVADLAEDIMRWFREWRDEYDRKAPPRPGGPFHAG